MVIILLHISLNKIMKVKDLIEMLQKLNPEAEIILEPTESMQLKQQFNYYDENGWEKEDIKDVL